MNLVASTHAYACRANEKPPSSLTPERYAEGGRVSRILQKQIKRLPAPRHQVAAYSGAVEGVVCELEFPQ